MGTSSTARGCPPSHDRILQTSDLGACPTLTFYCGERSTTICVVPGPERSSMYSYSGEYTSGFSGPAASHLAAPPSPRHEAKVGQAPSRMVKMSASSHGPWRVKREIYEKCAIRSPKFLVRCSENLELRTSNPPLSSLSCAAILRMAVLTALKLPLYPVPVPTP